MDGSRRNSGNSDAQVFEDGSCRLVLIGKTGSGKSATANTIIGRDCFIESSGLNSETKTGGYNYVHRDNLTVEVMDTPGLADTQDDDEILIDEIKKSVFAMHPGPHALLLVLKGKDRFTKEEFQVYQSLKEIFGTEFPSYLIVIFTSVSTKEEYAKEIKDQIRRCAHLNTVLTEANWRYVLFDNKADENEKKMQVHFLLEKVQGLFLSNQSNYFRHNFSDHLQTPFDEMLKDEIKILKAKMLRNSGDAYKDTLEDLSKSSEEVKAKHKLGELQKVSNDETPNSSIQQTQKIKTNNEHSVRNLAHQFDSIQQQKGMVKRKPDLLPKPNIDGARILKTHSSHVNKNALESDKQKCKNLSNANEITEQGNIETDNELHRQSEIDIKDKVVNHPEEMTETQRHVYRTSLSELPGKVKMEFDNADVETTQKCKVM